MDPIGIADESLVEYVFWSVVCASVTQNCWHYVPDLNVHETHACANIYTLKWPEAELQGTFLQPCRQPQGQNKLTRSLVERHAAQI